MPAEPATMNSGTGLLPPITEPPLEPGTPPRGIVRQAPPVDDRAEFTAPPTRWASLDTTTGSGRIPPVNPQEEAEAPPFPDLPPVPADLPIPPAPRPGRRGLAGSGTGSFRISPPKLPGAHNAKRWQIALSAVLVAVVLAGCGFGGYMMVQEESNKGTAKPTAAPSPQPRDISSQTADPVPLTAAEIFAAPEIKPVPEEPGYQVLKTQESADCKVAATDELGALIANLGCTQVVRGTLKHPTGQYLITIGLFNFKDEASAQQARESIEPNVNAQKGRLTGLIAGTGTEAIVRAPTQLAWDYRGHFLAWCVIARADSQPFTEGDAYPKQIFFDLLETHLIEVVVGARAAPLPESSAAPTDSASPAPAS
jgi:hypothetical protein